MPCAYSVDMMIVLVFTQMHESLIYDTSVTSAHLADCMYENFTNLGILLLRFAGYKSEGRRKIIIK
jgi:hypothetical protein